MRPRLAPKLLATMAKPELNHYGTNPMRTTISILFTGATLALSAQNSAVVNAYNYMKDGDLAKAAEYIEPAIAHEATMGKEKTWRYRGDIYRLIVVGQDANLKAQFPNALQRGIDSYLKAIELDTKGEYKRDNMTAMAALQGEALNAGNDAFGSKNYDQAILMYGESERVSKAFGLVDSNAVFNSALAYETKGDAAMAMQRYRSASPWATTRPRCTGIWPACRRSKAT